MVLDVEVPAVGDAEGEVERAPVGSEVALLDDRGGFDSGSGGVGAEEGEDGSGGRGGFS